MPSSGLAPLLESGRPACACVASTCKAGEHWLPNLNPNPVCLAPSSQVLPCPDSLAKLPGSPPPPKSGHLLPDELWLLCHPALLQGPGVQLYLGAPVNRPTRHPTSPSRVSIKWQGQKLGPAPARRGPAGVVCPALHSPAACPVGRHPLDFLLQRCLAWRQPSPTPTPPRARAARCTAWCPESGGEQVCEERAPLQEQDGGGLMEPFLQREVPRTSDCTRGDLEWGT